MVISEVASAFVSLVPSAKNFGGLTEKQIGPGLEKAGKSGGSKLSGALGGFLKKSAIGIGVAAGGILGTALFSGFKRLDAIDQAKAKLAGLGDSASTVSKIMDNALASVKGTAFGLDEAATVSATVVAAGIKPGQELTKTLKLVADAATIGGTSMGEMGAIFSKVATSNKVQGDIINQLNSKGIPIVQLLGKTMHKTAAEVMDMSKKGEIGFAQFSKAMQKGMGGAALKSGNTFSGAFANMKAALGRFGAGLLTGVFPIAKRVFGGITGLLDKVTKKVQPFADAFSAQLPGAMKTVSKVIGPVATKLGEIAKITWGKLTGGIDALKKLTQLDFSKIDGKKLGTQLGTAIADALNSLMSLSGKVTDSIGKMLNKIDWVGLGIDIGKQAPALLIGLAAGLLNFDVGALLKGLGKHWQDIVIGIIMIAFAPTKIIGPLGRLLAKIPFVGKFLEIAVRWVNELGGKLLKFGGDLLKSFWEGFSRGRFPGAGFVKKVMDAVKGLPGRLKDLWLTIQTRLGVWALDAFEAAGRGARRGVNGLLSFVAHLPGRILRALGSLARTLFPRGTELVSGLARGAAGAFGKVKAFLGSIRGKVAGSLKGAAGWLVGAGRAVIQGLMNGIKAMAGSVASAAASVVKGAVNSAKHALGIHSPSKVFHGIGVNVGRGLADGMDSMRKAVLESAGQLATSVLATVAGVTPKKIAKGLTGAKAAKAMKAAVVAAAKATASRRKAVNEAFGGFSLSSVLPQAENLNVITAAMRGALADLSKSVKDAGGKVTKTFGTLSASLVAGARTLDKEIRKRDALSTVLDASKQALTDLTASAKDFASTVASKFVTDAFATPEGTDALGFFNSTVDSDTASAKAFQTALQGAVTKGLDGPLFAELAQSGNTQLAQALAGLTSAQVDLEEQKYALRAQVTAGLGAYSSGQAFDPQLAAQNSLISQQTTTLAAQNRLLTKTESTLTTLQQTLNGGITVVVSDKAVHAGVVRQSSKNKRQIGTTGLPS